MEPAVLPVTAPLLELLRRRRVFQTVGDGLRWRVGERFAVDPEARIEPYATLYAGYQIPRGFGAFSYSRSEMALHAVVGRYCSLGEGIAWTGPDHPLDWATTSPIAYDGRLPALRAFQAAHDPDPPAPRPFAVDQPQITLGNDVWIGDGAMIAAGVTIGHGAVIGARSYVREDVAPYTIMVGSPARPLRLRFPEPLAARFLALEWWRFAPDVIQRLPLEEPERFLDALEARLASDPPREMAPPPLTFAEIQAAAEA